MLAVLNMILGPFWQAFARRRRVRLLVHRAYFSTGEPCLFLNLTNVSQGRDIEITHVYFDVEPQVHALRPERRLPKRLKPDETWETWLEASRLPADLGDSVYRLGRARVSSGRIIKSAKNKTVPSQGYVPGDP